ncbi:hypothetical protein ACWT_4055 [Actinoplanes sp. SE50]|nr:hypothetical protein ACPL_4184 [Actinoplanes sp. SE50/110]ATO83470.1 hypothetical protein ACWT_4055 [Actinoplanes sp. SE50]SLM00877.1 hypothetical protein ACSP50_4110 [Actinoplanes sp. SE50/110]
MGKAPSDAQFITSLSRRLGAVLAVTTAALTVNPYAAGAAPGDVSATKSGTVAETGSSSDVAAGQRINWVIGLHNGTNAAVPAQVTDPVEAGQAFVPGSLRAPTGYTTAFSADGSAYASEQPATVKSVRVAGAVLPAGTNGSEAPVKPAGKGFVGNSGGGDGTYAAFFGSNVYTVHHHRAPGAKLMECHDKATGAVCPGYETSTTFFSSEAGKAINTGADDYYTALSPGTVVDQSSGRLYFPAQRGAADGNHNTVGVACVDLVSNRSCGFTVLAGDAMPRVRGGIDLSGAALVRGRLYLRNETGKLFCFDSVKGTGCAGFPVTVDAAAAANTDTTEGARAQTDAFDDRYVFTSFHIAGRIDLVCFDTTTNAVCPGFPKSEPAAGDASKFFVPMLDHGGAVTGACWTLSANHRLVGWRCYSIQGEQVATPTGFPAAGTSVLGYDGLGSPERLGARIYLPMVHSDDTSTYMCYDFATGGPCAGVAALNTGLATRTYSLREDPAAPGCLWSVGDSGRFEVFDAAGHTGCNVAIASVPAIVPASYYCDNKTGHVKGWATLALTGIEPSRYASAVVTLRDATNQPVAGFDRIALKGQELDLSSIPATGATARLTADVVLTAPTGDAVEAGKAAVTLAFRGDDPQVCLSTKVDTACASDGVTAVINEANLLVGTRRSTARASLRYARVGACKPDGPDASTPVAAPATPSGGGSGLPLTGSPVMLVGIVGAVLILGGGVTMMLMRRRRNVRFDA